MVVITKTNAFEIDADKRRVVKVTRFSLSDVLTALQASPPGIDGGPRKNLKAIFAESMEKGSPVILGYLNKNQLAGAGELRLFSEDGNAALKAYVWLKADGTIEFAGALDNLVRFSKLEDAMTQLADDINAELTKIQTAITGLGGAYVMTPITIDISDAKIDELKTS